MTELILLISLVTYLMLHIFYLRYKEWTKAWYEHLDLLLPDEDILDESP